MAALAEQHVVPRFVRRLYLADVAERAPVDQMRAFEPPTRGVPATPSPSVGDRSKPSAAETERLTGADLPEAKARYSVVVAMVLVPPARNRRCRWWRRPVNDRCAFG